MVYDPKSRGAEAYRDLARELLARNGIFVASGNPAGTVVHLADPESEE
jgi:chromosome partitioning protein